MTYEVASVGRRRWKPGPGFGPQRHPEPTRDDHPVPEDQWMLGHVQSLTFDCYDGTQWRNSWDTTVSDTNLPIAVRVSIQLAGEGPGDPRAREPIVLMVPIDSQSRTNQVPTAGS